MLGAIFGDIVGSVYERKNTKREDFPLLSKWSHPTDDSMMTLAVARALMNTWGRSDDEIRAELVRSMQDLGRRYPNAGYGRAFAGWLYEKDPLPYNSFGNGSAMRVSPQRLILSHKSEVILYCLTDFTEVHGQSRPCSAPEAPQRPPRLFRKREHLFRAGCNRQWFRCTACFRYRGLRLRCQLRSAWQ